jgi:NAD(P)H-quinone oxidoreductase subunit 4
VFIIACLLVPIIGIGLYPKIVTQIYDASTNQLTALLRQSVPTLVEETATTPPWQKIAVKAPSLP